MRSLEAPDLRIDRIVESEGPTYPPDVLLPDLSPDAIDEHRDWLVPRFLDPATDLLQMSFHSFVVRRRGRTILVDACVGDDKDRPGFPDWHRQRSGYLAGLSACGLAPEDVDLVFCTHLHPDHVGWNTRLRNGRWTPTFPNATYLFGRTEWEHWSAFVAAVPADETDPVRAVVAAAFRDSVAPVVEAGRHRLVEDACEIAEGIRVVPAPGHTPGNAVVEIACGGRSIVLSGDVLHHPLQLAHPEVSSAFCFDPEASRRTREAFLERHREVESLLLPAHFPSPTAVLLGAASPGFRFLQDPARELGLR